MYLDVPAEFDISIDFLNFCVLITRLAAVARLGVSNEVERREVVSWCRSVPVGSEVNFDKIEGRR